MYPLSPYKLKEVNGRVVRGNEGNIGLGALNAGLEVGTHREVSNERCAIGDDGLIPSLRFARLRPIWHSNLVAALKNAIACRRAMSVRRGWKNEPSQIERHVFVDPSTCFQGVDSRTERTFGNRNTPIIFGL